MSTEQNAEIPRAHKRGRPSLSKELARLMSETCPVSGLSKTRMTAVCLVKLAWGGSVQAHALIADRLDGRVPTEVNVVLAPSELNGKQLDDELTALAMERQRIEDELAGIALASENAEREA